MIFDKYVFKSFRAYLVGANLCVRPGQTRRSAPTEHPTVFGHVFRYKF